MNNERPPRLFLPVLLVLFAAAGLLSGCASQRELTSYRDIITTQARDLDSLRAEHSLLLAEAGGLRDSLQFCDDVETGRIYRQIRTLNDRIERLDYEAVVTREGGVELGVYGADELFEPGTATLTKKGMVLLDSASVPLAARYAGRPIRVEGHSDSVPVGGSLAKQYPTNWELSSARAAVVARYLIEAHSLEGNRFMVVGYADTRPIASNGSADGRRRNRRVRIAVLPEEVAQAAD